MCHSLVDSNYGKEEDLPTDRSIKSLIVALSPGYDTCNRHFMHQTRFNIGRKMKSTSFGDIIFYQKLSLLGIVEAQT